jgi:uncharacterized protein (DUF885 family)
VTAGGRVLKGFSAVRSFKGFSVWIKGRRRQLAVGLGVLGLFLGITFLLFLYQGDEHQFTQMSQSLFREEMRENTLNMHYTIAKPIDFGIYQYEPVLPVYSKEQRMQGQEQLQDLLKFLDTVNPQRLDTDNRYTYQLLQRALGTALQMSEYSYYDEPLSPGSGMQSQLPILLAEYAFRSKQDVEDYLSLLDQTDTYFASLVTFEEEKAGAGLFMNSASLQQVLEQCETIVNQNDLQEGSHFLQTTFVERLEGLYGEGLLSKEEAKYYIAQNNRLLSTVVAPAYEALYDGLFVLEDDRIPLEGLAAKPNGSAYYELLVQSETGSSRPIAEIKEMLTHQLEAEFGALHNLLTAYPELVLMDYDERFDDAFPYYTPSQMLLDLQERMEEDFPALTDAGNKGEADGSTATIGSAANSGETGGEPGADGQAVAIAANGGTVAATGIAATANVGAAAVNGGTVAVNSEAAAASDQVALPVVTVKSVSESLEKYSAPAYYLTPPIDDSDNNVIYINERNSPSGLELYTTLAHEGYPGHMYQTVYSNRRMLGLEDNYVRQILWYGGYQEGWAMYVEFFSFDYAAELLSEAGYPELVPAVSFEQHNRSLLLCLYSLLDILIHYDNASYEEVREVLHTCGIIQESSVLSIYEYLAEEPANYLKYYVGYLEILELKQEAQTLWGDAYSDYAFHTFILNCGPSDFDTIREALQDTEPVLSPQDIRESNLLSLTYALQRAIHTVPVLHLDTALSPDRTS